MEQPAREPARWVQTKIIINDYQHRRGYPERSINTNTNFFLRRSIDRRIGQVKDFLCQALFAVFCAIVLLAFVVFPFYTGHNLRAPSCMNNK